MFKGTNTIKLNRATMIAAIQEYLERRMLPSAEDFRVTNVLGNGMSADFEVTVQEVEQPERPSSKND